jgi:hypothetical protein
MQKLKLSEAEQELIKQDILHKEAELNRKMYSNYILSYSIMYLFILIGGKRYQSRTLSLCLLLEEGPLVKLEYANTRNQGKLWL